jgi:hypothetical protein
VWLLAGDVNALLRAQTGRFQSPIMPAFRGKAGAARYMSEQAFMKKLILDISLPADRYEALYTGSVKDVQVISREGVRVRFPGMILQKYLKHDGVHGTFVIEFDDTNKFRAITKIV